MKQEPDKIFIAGGHYSPASKVIAIVLGSIMVLSALLLAFIFVGLLLPLLVLAAIVLWATRRWRVRVVTTPGRMDQNGRQTMEGEYTVVPEAKNGRGDKSDTG